MGYANSVVEESLKQQKFDDCYASYLLLGKRNNDVSDDTPAMMNTWYQFLCFSSCFNWTVRGAGVVVLSHCEPWPRVREEDSRVDQQHPAQLTPATLALEQDTEECRDPSARPPGTSLGAAARVGNLSQGWPVSWWVRQALRMRGKVGIDWPCSSTLIVLFLVFIQHSLTSSIILHHNLLLD